MRIMRTLTALALLAGCASPGSYGELQAAQQRLDLHERADIYMDMDLIDKGSTTQAQRLAEVRARKVQTNQCDADFHKAFTVLFEEAPKQGSSALAFAVTRAQQIDGEFDRCVSRFGLTGQPEFKVGDAYLRTPAFVRSFADAARQAEQARHMVESQAQSNASALAVGWGMRERAPLYAPPPSPAAPTVRQPIRCTSYRYGSSVNTTCQ